MTTPDYHHAYDPTAYDAYRAQRSMNELRDAAAQFDVELDFTPLQNVLADRARAREIAEEKRRKRLEELEAHRERVRKEVAARNLELLAPLSKYREAAAAGWEAMRLTAPLLDGVSTFDEIPPKAQFRYLSFAAAVLGEPYTGPLPEFVKVAKARFTGEDEVVPA